MEGRRGEKTRRHPIPWIRSDPLVGDSRKECRPGAAGRRHAAPRRAHRSACPRRASPGVSPHPARRTAAGRRAASHTMAAPRRPQLAGAPFTRNLFSSQEIGKADYFYWLGPRIATRILGTREICVPFLLKQHPRTIFPLHRVDRGSGFMPPPHVSF